MRALVLAGIVYAQLSPAFAQPDAWEFRGLAGHAVLSLAPVNSVSSGYAATNVGLYYTAGGGASWDTLYVYGPRTGVRACVRAGVYRDSTVFLAWGWGSRSDGLWFSSDRGATWSVRTWMLYPNVVEYQGFAGSSPMFLASDTLDAGLWRSTDAGLTWARCSAGVPVNVNVCDVSVQYYYREHVLCGTSGSGAYVSHDSGKTWQQTWPGSAPVRSVIWTWDPYGARLAVGGAGDSSGIWFSADGNPPWRRELAVSEASALGGSFWAGFLGDSGAYFSYRGSPWEPRGEGLANRMVRTLEGDWEVWAGTEDGVFTTIVWPGVEERFASLAQRVTAGATFVRGVLHLGAGTVPERGLSRAVLLDAAGRTAMALKPGPNDVRHLPAGVYFVRPSGTVPAGQGTVPIRAKAVIQR